MQRATIAESLSDWGNVMATFVFEFLKWHWNAIQISQAMTSTLLGKEAETCLCMAFGWTSRNLVRLTGKFWNYRCGQLLAGWFTQSSSWQQCRLQIRAMDCQMPRRDILKSVRKQIANYIITDSWSHENLLEISTTVGQVHQLHHHAGQTVTEAGYGWIHFGVVKLEGKLGKDWRSSLELQWGSLSLV